MTFFYEFQIVSKDLTTLHCSVKNNDLTRTIENTCDWELSTFDFFFSKDE